MCVRVLLRVCEGASERACAVQCMKVRKSNGENKSVRVLGYPHEDIVYSLLLWSWAPSWPLHGPTTCHVKLRPRDRPLVFTAHVILAGAKRPSLLLSSPLPTQASILCLPHHRLKGNEQGQGDHAHTQRWGGKRDRQTREGQPRGVCSCADADPALFGRARASSSRHTTCRLPPSPCRLTRLTCTVPRNLRPRLVIIKSKPHLSAPPPPTQPPPSRVPQLQ